MTEINIKAKLINAINQAVPEEENAASLIAKLLGIGKESAYRRLRGNVNFSFTEVAIIANRLGISLDDLFGLIQQEDALFKLRLLNEGHSIDVYMNKLAEYTKVLQQMNSNSHNVVLRLAQNSLSLYNILRHYNLSKFYMYNWLRYTQAEYTNLKFSEFELPEKFTIIQNKYVAEIQKISHFILILDPNVYASSVKDIDYFHHINLLTQEDEKLIKQDLLSSINNLEEMATTGHTKRGAKVDMYVSSINIETSYIHIESENQNYSEFLVYALFSLDTQNTSLNQTQKDWIDSLKKYCTSISQCGEIERYNFFNKQRELIRG